MLLFILSSWTYVLVSVFDSSWQAELQHKERQSKGKTNLCYNYKSWADSSPVNVCLVAHSTSYSVGQDIQYVHICKLDKKDTLAGQLMWVVGQILWLCVV